MSQHCSNSVWILTLERPASLFKSIKLCFLTQEEVDIYLEDAKGDVDPYYKNCRIEEIQVYHPSCAERMFYTAGVDLDLKVRWVVKNKKWSRITNEHFDGKYMIANGNSEKSAIQNAKFGMKRYLKGESDGF
jgi:hypothetical protein